MKNEHIQDKTLYPTWRAMKMRCNCRGYSQYKDYGGRGIKILWKTYASFYSDMIVSFREHMKNNGSNTTIDRINNNGHYSKDNCRWSTRTEQRRNQRNIRTINFNGRSQCLSDWAEELGIGVQTLWERLRLGFSVEEALTMKLHTKRNK